MAKRRKVITFYLCLNLTMEDFCICNSAEQIVKPGKSSQTQQRMG